MHNQLHDVVLIASIEKRFENWSGWFDEGGVFGAATQACIKRPRLLIYYYFIHFYIPYLPKFYKVRMHDFYARISIDIRE